MAVVMVGDRAEVIMNNRDLVYLINREMGTEVAHLVTNVVHELEEYRENEERIDKEILEENREMYDILVATTDITKELRTTLEQIDVLNRNKLIEKVKEIDDLTKGLI